MLYWIKLNSVNSNNLTNPIHNKTRSFTFLASGCLSSTMSDTAISFVFRRRCRLPLRLSSSCKLLVSWSSSSSSSLSSLSSSPDSVSPSSQTDRPFDGVVLLKTRKISVMFENLSIKMVNTSSNIIYFRNDLFELNCQSGLLTIQSNFFE